MRLVRGLGDEVGLRARFPSGWYAQPYAASNLLITSFPVHVANPDLWSAIPAGGTAMQVYDQPPGSFRQCRRLRGAHPHLPLGRYEPNYEGIGAAFRSQFHDHGHAVLVFTSFGGSPPTPPQRLLADRVLNSIHVLPHECPVKEIVAVGKRASALTALVTREAGSKGAANRSHPGAYAPKLSATRGSVGTAVTITGAIPATGENGQPVHLARLVVWWNLDPYYPSPRVPRLTPARPGRLSKLAVIRLTPTQSRYRASLTVPRACPGRYPVVVLQEAEDGSVAGLGSASFVVASKRPDRPPRALVTRALRQLPGEKGCHVGADLSCLR